MSENFDQFSEEEINELKQKFIQMKDTHSGLYLDVDEYEQLIDYFFEKENTENIEIAISFALEQHPNNYDFLLKKAQLLALNGQDEQGLQILDDIASLGNDPDYFMIKGTLLSNLQKYREAIEEYTKALNKGQDLEEVYANIAFEYENLEQYNKAIEYINKVLEINPKNEAALNEAGICFEMSNQSADAIEYFNDFLDQHPYSRSAWFNLAIALNSYGDNEKAIEAYEFSLAIDENQASALFNIANIYAGLNDHDKAIRYYKETLSKETPDTITYYYMGESYEKLDNFDEALSCYKKSIKINSGFHEAYVGIARCYFSIGDEEQAYHFIGEAVDLGEPFPLFWSIRSLKLDEQGFFKLAKMAVLQLIKKNPAEVLYSINLALLLSNHDLRKAIEILNDTLIQYSDTKHLAIILYLKGIYLVQMGNDEKGLSYFEKAILLNKEDINNPLIQGELLEMNHNGLNDLMKKYDLS
jgi:tetratricopeptide (TPR) repeat protein